MKRLFFFVLLAAAVTAANAQKKVITHYNSVTKSDTTRIVWEETVTENGRQVTIVIGPQTTVIYSDKDYITRECHITDQTQGTDVTITLSSGKYLIQGTFKKKAYKSEHKSSGKLWIQNISYSVGHLSHIKGDFQYECFRPDNLDFSEMQAINKGNEEFRSTSVKSIKICPAGLKAAFWSCHYYLNDRWEYVGYRGVNGGPGTPETIMYRVD